MEEIDEKRITELGEIADKLLDQRLSILTSYDIEDILKEELVGKTDELLSVLILGIGGESFDEKVTKEVE